MSRLANMPITIPSSVKVSLEGKEGSFSVNLTNGKVNTSWTVHPAVKVLLEDNQLRLDMSEKNIEDKFNRAMLGTDYRHIEGLIKGLDKPFEVALDIVGLGYKAKLVGDEVVLFLGKSHNDHVKIPSDVDVVLPNEREIICKSYSKKILGDFRALLCSKRKPDAYKAKGVRVRGRHYRTKSEK